MVLFYYIVYHLRRGKFWIVETADSDAHQVRHGLKEYEDRCAAFHAKMLFYAAPRIRRPGEDLALSFEFRLLTFPVRYDAEGAT